MYGEISFRADSNCALDGSFLLICLFVWIYFRHRNLQEHDKCCGLFPGKHARFCIYV